MNYPVFACAAKRLFFSLGIFYDLSKESCPTKIKIYSMHSSVDAPLKCHFSYGNISSIYCSESIDCTTRF